jgi:transcriptional regulator with XRE-family HTH domain
MLTIQDMSPGEKLTQWLDEANWSDRYFAGLLEVSPSTVGNWKSGRSRPRLDDLVAIRKITGLSIDYWALDDLTEPIALTPAEQQAVILTRALALSVEEVARRLAGNAVPTNPGVHSPEYAQPVGPEIELPFRRPAPSHKDAKRDDKRPEPEGAPKRRR